MVDDVRINWRAPFLAESQALVFSSNHSSDQWIAHTPPEVLAKNFGVNASVFTTVPAPDPYILNGTVTTVNSTGPSSGSFGNSSYVFHDSPAANIPVPGGGGTLKIIDSRNFPIATTIAATVVNLLPNSLR
jgi:oxalate decarboxylase